MRVFKYLVTLADISVGFLGLFFIIFAVTRPTALQELTEKRKLEHQLEQLRQQIGQLEKIELSKASTAQKMTSEQSAKIIVERQRITVELQGQKRRFRSINRFDAVAKKMHWPASLVLYVDRRVPFDNVVKIIDVLKRIDREIAVRIAALAE